MAGTNDPRTDVADLTVFTGGFVLIGVVALGRSKPGIAVRAPATTTAEMNQRYQDEMPSPSPANAVHRDILGKSSKWLKKRLSDPSVTSIQLNTSWASPQTLTCYLNWLYFGTFATKRPQQTVETIQGISDDAEYLDLIELWSLCIWLEDQQAADDVINAFVAKMKEVQPLRLPGPKCIAQVFSKVHLRHPALRRLIAAVYAAEASADQLDVISYCTNEAFHRALTAELAQLRIENRQKVSSMNSCGFHKHAANEPCESSEKARKRRRLG